VVEGAEKMPRKPVYSFSNVGVFLVKPDIMADLKSADWRAAAFQTLVYRRPIFR
jgi:hypothetical protein